MSDETTYECIYCQHHISKKSHEGLPRVCPSCGADARGTDGRIEEDIWEKVT